VSEDHTLLLLVRSFIFPNPYTNSSTPSMYNKSRTTSISSGNTSMNPTDCPPGTLRAELVGYMTSVDTNLKRITAELLYTLCMQNGRWLYLYLCCYYLFIYIFIYIVDEFIYRTGFGNAIALLKIKGLA
jgi:hypothetical protein